MRVCLKITTEFDFSFGLDRSNKSIYVLLRLILTVEVDFCFVSKKEKNIFLIFNCILFI